MDMRLVVLKLYTPSNLNLKTRSHLMGMFGVVFIILGHLRWMQGSRGISVERFDLWSVTALKLPPCLWFV